MRNLVRDSFSETSPLFQAMALPTRSLTLAARVTLYTATFLAMLQSQRLDAALQKVWDVLRRSKLVQHDSFEPVLVAFCFAAWHAIFYMADTCLFQTLKQWRIQPSDDRQHWTYTGGKRLRGEFTAVVATYYLPILAFDWLHPRRQLPPAAPSFMRFSLEVLASLLVYDALFFAVHLACHKVPSMYKAVHATHHTKLVQRASETLRLSPLEVLADTMCSVAALNLVRAHPLSRLSYNVVITGLVTELHSGYDLPWSLQNLLPGVWAGSRRHDWHHSHSSRYYQKFFCYLDDMYDCWRRESGAQAASAAAAAQKAAVLNTF